ncbi:epoxide hydrolase 1-like [Branchiostoma floridae]|uniref:Epoxide hydrolase n=1 Tax=Branchiostoma floridae TaxID=7739 RepID=A0A9J7K766_BRAFL|nr:epoxide hydrolase 1-like [Branchiostoma floridae]XP_035659497.1 epoxide hydrolase 1-like [Branchiostoma floridae]
MGWKLTTFFVIVAVAIAVLFSGVLKTPPEPLEFQDNYWGRGAKPSPDTKQDENVYGIIVNVSDSALADLKNRLSNTRFFDALEDVQFQYGFRREYMIDLVTYWKTQYDWRKQEAYLNTLSHYKTNIEGIDLHFIHAKPKLKPGQTAKPLLIVHGWPGSVFEFYKMIPMLVDPTSHGGSEDDVFEVIAPSIPGYGFSEIPHKKGFDQIAAAQMFHKLMERLGFQKFYVQGGDWGAMITRNMAVLKPSVIKGLHTNMPTIEMGGAYAFYMMLGSVAPSLAGLTEADYKRLYPVSKKLLDTLQESGYFHLQASKPDTVGFALNDSPVGLAAYILEKFSTWTNPANRDLADGGLEKYYTKDELLTSVMMYWVTGTIPSSMRFYKEAFAGKALVAIGLPVTVPSGVVAFPHEIISHVPESFCYWGYPNLVHYTTMPTGGHFPAFEQPALLAEDIRAFARKVEALDTPEKGTQQ